MVNTLTPLDDPALTGAKIDVLASWGEIAPNLAPGLWALSSYNADQPQNDGAWLQDRRGLIWQPAQYCPAGGIYELGGMRVTVHSERYNTNRHTSITVTLKPAPSPL